MKQSITSFLFFGATAGGVIGLIGVGERVLSWSVSLTLGAIGGLALLGALFSILPYLLWSAKNRPAESEETGEQDVSDFPLESQYHSSEDSFHSRRMKDLEEFSREIAELLRNSRKENTPYHCVQILLRSTADAGKYEFVAKNTGKRDLWNLYFDECDLLNIDDTHMPKKSNEWPPIKIEHLPAHSEARFFTITPTEKFPYRPPSNRQVKLAYAFKQDGSQSGYAPAYLSISHEVPAIRPTPSQSYSAFDTPTFNRLASYLISSFKRLK